MDNNMKPEYSTNDELYKSFGRGFVKSLHEGVQIAQGKKRGTPAREHVRQLMEDVEKMKAEEAQNED